MESLFSRRLYQVWFKGGLGLFLFITSFSLYAEIEAPLPTLWKGLSGDVGVLVIYVDTPAQKWEIASKNIWKKKTKRALAWFSHQAKLNDVKLHFKPYEFHIEISKFPIKKDNYPDNQSGWFEEVVQKLGYKSHKDLITEYQKRLSVDSVGVLIYVPHVFISHTTFLPSVSIISLKQPPSFHEDYVTRACTIAHELLHQYGANHTTGPKFEIMAPGAGRENTYENFIGVETGEQVGWKVINPIAWKEWDLFIHDLASHQKVDAAFKEVKKALKRNPHFKKGHFWYDLGNIYYLKKEYSKALDAYESALKEDPHNPEILKSKESIERLRPF